MLCSLLLFSESNPIGNSTGETSHIQTKLDDIIEGGMLREKTGALTPKNWHSPISFTIDLKRHLKSKLWLSSYVCCI